MYGEILIDTDDDCLIETESVEPTTRIHVKVNGPTKATIRNKALEFLTDGLDIKTRKTNKVSPDPKVEAANRMLFTMIKGIHSHDLSSYQSNNMTFKWALHEGDSPFDLVL